MPGRRVPPHVPVRVPVRDARDDGWRGRGWDGRARHPAHGAARRSRALGDTRTRTITLPRVQVPTALTETGARILVLTGSRIRPIAESTRPVWHPVVEVLRWVSPLGWTVLAVGLVSWWLTAPLRLGRAGRWSRSRLPRAACSRAWPGRRAGAGAHPVDVEPDPGHRRRPGHRAHRGDQRPPAAGCCRCWSSCRSATPRPASRCPPLGAAAQPRGAVRRADPPPRGRPGGPGHHGARRPARAGAAHGAPGPSAPSCSCTRSPSRSRASAPGCCATSRAR